MTQFLKIASLLWLFLFTTQIVSGQIHKPVKWRTSVEQISDTEYDLVATSLIKRKWHVYSQTVPPNGPRPTVFSFTKSDDFELVDKPKEIGGKTINDPVFNMRIKYFERKGVFKQRIKIKNKKGFQVLGEVEFMVCDDTRCLPPKFIDLIFDIPVITSKTAVKKATNSIEKKRGNNQEKGKKKPIDEVKKTVKKETSVKVDETKKPIDTVQNSIANISEEKEIDSTIAVAEKKLDSAVENSKSKASKKEDNKGLWTIFFLAFFSGFAALLTPCVFPMIPMTVSFFTKQSKTKAMGIRNAIIYGLSIIIIYVILGTVVTGIFGASALNELATNVWFNIIFFLILVVFAVSFLGAFEIMLPNSWMNKVDSQANKGGFIGIFFMALALAVVSFSCTGPIVGTLLVEASSKGGIAPIIGMLGFSLAIALPFALFAAFPGWLNALPKSGGWLNTVKVVLGFLELALAFKFLSQADLVLQFHWLEREVFLAIWIAIFGTLALYLFGKIQLPHDSPLKSISVGRLSLGLLTLAFTIYMIPGLWGAPLNLISAFPPPQNYSESPYGVGFTKIGDSSTQNHHSALPEGAHLLAPHDIIAFNDYDKGLAYAKTINKPVLIDFTGWACVNCRKMEQNVWPKENILPLLKNDVVLISLYVDERAPFPEGMDDNSKLRPGKKLRYIGQKWSELQEIKYKANAQPFYVLMDHNEDNLNTPVAYTPDVNEYQDWLKEGINAFKK